MGQSRTALVTGTSAGLGRAIAVALAREGYDLALTELSIDALKDTLADPAIAQRKAVPIALDLRSQDSIKAAFEKAAKELGNIDLLVNNAGRALLRPVVEVTDAEWDDVIDTNLKGAFFLSQLFGRACIAKGRPGAIVNMASTHGMTGISGRSVYGISKAGLIQMTRMLAIEWADKNIRVNAIAPTTVMTESRQQIAQRSEGAGQCAGAHSVRTLRHSRRDRRRRGLSREPGRGVRHRPYAAGRWRTDRAVTDW